MITNPHNPQIIIIEKLFTQSQVHCKSNMSTVAFGEAVNPQPKRDHRHLVHEHVREVKANPVEEILERHVPNRDL